MSLVNTTQCDGCGESLASPNPNDACIVVNLVTGLVTARHFGMTCSQKCGDQVASFLDALVQRRGVVPGASQPAKVEAAPVVEIPAPVAPTEGSVAPQEG